MGGSPSQQWAQDFEKQAEARAAQAYGIGMPALTSQYQGIQAMQAMGGEPRALQQAFGGARAGLTDAATMSSADALRREQERNAGAAAGGNIGAGMAMPADMGTSIARALYGSRLTEAQGAIEEQNKMFGMGLGQAQQAGSGAISAMGTQLGAIPTMQQYNTSYANVLGALNLGASLYGGLNQAGVFGSSTGLGGLGPGGVPVGSTQNIGGLSGVNFT